MGPRFATRYLVQIAALAVVVIGLSVLAVMAFRSSNGGGVGGKPPLTSPATATADPRVDEVKAVARRYLAAFWESAKTGDVTAVRALTESDSQAQGTSLVAATLSKTAHHNFMAGRIDVDETTWQVDALSDHASARVSYRLYGHDAEWPTLKARESDHFSAALTDTFQLDLVGTKWLVSKYN